jgi:hypothetical protein
MDFQIPDSIQWIETIAEACTGMKDMGREEKKSR